MIIDIREGSKDEIEGIKFDSSSDYIFGSLGSIMLHSVDGGQITLCETNEIDSLIKALQKAKEIWG
jgi:hypothetical protein